jgi:uncharacterized protein DUF4136
MKIRRFLILLLPLAFPVQGALAGPKVSAQAAPGVNFGAYQNYAWVNLGQTAVANPVMYQSMVGDLDAALASKAYTRAEPADISLVLTIGAREKTDIESWGRFGLQTSVYQYTVGQLSLDAFDTKTQQALWHGQATGTIDPDKPNPAKVRAAIDKLMQQFPARVPAAAMTPQPSR